MTEATQFLEFCAKQKYLPCRDEEVREFFFVSPKYESPENTAAKELCSVCPIVTECAAEGFRIKDRSAIYGGLTPEDRNTILNNQEIAA